LESVLHAELESSTWAAKPNYDLVWEAAACLVAREYVASNLLPAAIVNGGFHNRDRHDEVVETVKRLLSRQSPLTEKITAGLWKAVSNAKYEGRDKDSVAWGAARTLIESGLLTLDTILCGVSQVAEEDEPGKSTDVLRVLLAEASDEPVASRFLSAVKKQVRTGNELSRALAELLDDKNSSIAFAAAQMLMESGDTEHLSLPIALIKGGFADSGLADDVSRTLIRLSNHPVMAQAVRAAILLGLTDQKERTVAWRAAAHIMDHGGPIDRTVPLALASGRWMFAGSREDTRNRLEKLLAAPTTRPPTLDALVALLTQDEEPEAFYIASLLVRGGAPLYDSVLEALRKPVRWEWAIAPLAVLALADRVDEARDTSKRLGLSSWTVLLGESSFPHT
jgi:hypothetical protein